MEIGHRWLDFDRTSGSGTNTFTFDAQMSGPFPAFVLGFWRGPGVWRLEWLPALRTRNRKEDAMRSAIVVLLLCAAAAVAGDGKGKSEHPHFDDQGTLRWYTDLGGAQSAAKRAGKLILIEYGREA